MDNQTSPSKAPIVAEQTPLPNLPVLPSLFEQLLPTPVPPLRYKPGLTPILENFIHNWKLGQIQRGVEREAAIAEAKLKETRARFAQITELLLFGPKYELALKQIRTDTELLEINKQKALVELNHQQLVNFQLQIDCQKAQFELEQMLKDNGGDGENGQGA